MFELKGPVRAIHQFVNMSSEEVDYKVPGTNEVIRGRGCRPAMGHTFSSGTTDGPGLFTFETGSTVSTNPLWNLANQLVPKPSREQIDCHAEKTILISTGEVSAPTVYVRLYDQPPLGRYDPRYRQRTAEPIAPGHCSRFWSSRPLEWSTSPCQRVLFFSQFNYPSAWSPSVVSTQLASVGPSFVVACVPGEFTTMSGRRVRKAVAETYCMRPPCVVVIAGLCNSYSDYITTPEEYKVSEHYRVRHPAPPPLPEAGRDRAGFAFPFLLENKP